MNILDKFALADDVVYLNNAAAGLLPTTSLSILEDIHRKKSKLGIESVELSSYMSHYKDFRKSIAKLIHGKEEAVGFAPSTAYGLHTISDALHDVFSPGKNIVITDKEYTTNSYIWQQVCLRYAMELRVVRYRNHEFAFQDWERLVDDRTAVVALSHVQYSNGYRSDLKSLSELAHGHGAYLVVDGIQSVGAVPIDVRREGVDFLAAGGYKWMLGPHGTGFYYISPALLPKLQSTLVGWFSSENYNEMTHNKFLPAHDSRKFQPAYDPSIRALTSSIDIVNAYGVENIYNHVLELLDFLINEIIAIGGEVLSSFDPECRSPILSVSMEGFTPDLVDYLKAYGIYTSYRENALRVSPHVYNNKEDILNLVENLKKWTNSR